MVKMRKEKKEGVDEGERNKKKSDREVKRF